jgi:hypothetical protein
MLKVCLKDKCHQDLIKRLSMYWRMPPFLKYSISTSVSSLTFTLKDLPVLVVTVNCSCTFRLPSRMLMLNCSFPVKPK